MQGLTESLLALGVWLVTAATAGTDPLVMPRELVEHARKAGCDQVESFFQREGMVTPPYAYGYLSGKKGDSAAFWCQTTNGDQREFYLVTMFKDEGHELAKCPRRMKWWNYPGGLEIYKDTRMSLDEFVYVKNPKRKGPRNVKATHNGIRSEYDGVESVFYCHQGEWLVRMRD